MVSCNYSRFSYIDILWYFYLGEINTKTMRTTDIVEAILSNAKYLSSHKDECAAYLHRGELLEVCMDLSYLVKQVKKQTK